MGVILLVFFATWYARRLEHDIADLDSDAAEREVSTRPVGTMP